MNVCPICGKFINMSLSLHIATYHAREYRCRYCGKMYTNAHALGGHVINTHIMSQELKLSDKDKNEVVKLYLEGVKVDEIAKRFSVTRNAIYRVLRSKNVTYRRRGELKKTKHDEKVLEELENFEKAGYRVIPLVSPYPIPDAILIKNGKVYALELEFSAGIIHRPEKYAELNPYDDIVWIIYRKTGRKDIVRGAKV